MFISLEYFAIEIPEHFVVVAVFIIFGDQHIQFQNSEEFLHIKKENREINRVFDATFLSIKIRLKQNKSCDWIEAVWSLFLRSLLYTGWLAIVWQHLHYHFCCSRPFEISFNIVFALWNHINKNNNRPKNWK